MRAGGRAAQAGAADRCTSPEKHSALILRSARSARLEGWRHTRSPRPCFETAASPPPRHEGGGEGRASGRGGSLYKSRKTLSPHPEERAKRASRRMAAHTEPAAMLRDGGFAA